jgi:hypothetical protein
MIVMEANGHDLRPEPLEARRKRLAKLLSRSNKALRDGIQLSEAITGDGAAIFRHACGLGLEGIVSKRVGSRYVSGNGLRRRTRISSRCAGPYGLGSAAAPACYVLREVRARRWPCAS